MDKPICEYCKDLEELEIDYPDEPHHGGIKECSECGAEYYVEYGGEYKTTNQQARLNHPSLKTL